MQSSHSLQPVFDDPNLVASMGLAPVLRLADRAGLTGLLDEHLSVDSPNQVVKSRTLIAGMLAGVDDIDGMDVLRAGATDQVIGPVRAPSTLGTFLRSFTHGGALQLGKVNRHLIAGLNMLTPSLLGQDQLVFVDLDDTIRELYGYQKEAVAHGYNKVKGLNAMIATISSDHALPVIASAGLRRGNARSGSNAAWYGTRTLSQVRELVPGRQVMVRADSAFYQQTLVAAAVKARAWFSITIPQWPNVTAAISRIDESAWTPIHYPNAIWDQQTGQLVSDAEVAEVPFTAFVSHPLDEQVDCRLVVRRVKRLGARPEKKGQGTLMDAYRYHAFVTNSSLTTVEADKRHRGHAIIAHNLSRAAAHAAGIPSARMATILATITSVPARIAHRARRLIAHLPEHWPWQQAFSNLWDIANGPPLTLKT